LSDIAKEVGVTAMTVSVVLNGARSATRVSDATRARIQEAAKRLNYRPNAVAQGLSRRRMDTIGVVASIDCGEVNHYFLEVLNGILEGAAQHGQNTTVFSVPSWDEDHERYRQICDGRVDGVIVIAPLFSSAFGEWLTQHSPLVAIHPNRDYRGGIHIQSDDENGMYLATRHLIGLGHRQIVHLSGREDLGGAYLRANGYRRAMAEAGIPLGIDSIIPSDFNVESGREQIARYMAETPRESMATALVCASDAIAYGCLEVLAASGISVPGHVSIVGFDDTILSRLTQPQMTTVKQPFRQMGRRAVELLLQELVADKKRGSDGDAPSTAAAPPRTEVFDVELVVRGSSGPPRE
jgi:LacI family transcriptional regulator